MPQLFQTERAAKGKTMLLFLPLLLFPFLSLLFWAGGGGKDIEVVQNKKDVGLNTQLPEAQMKNGRATDKLSFYQQASKDSLKKEEEKRDDPFWSSIVKKDSFGVALRNHDEHRSYDIDYNSLPPSPYTNNSIDANEAKVYEKLAKLNSALAQSKKLPNEKKKNTDDYSSPNGSSVSDTKKLEAMMRGMNETGNKDPELDQLNVMLDKIAAIQHPDAATNSRISFDTTSTNSSWRVHNRKSTGVTLLTPKGSKDNSSPVGAQTKAAFYSDEVLSALANDSVKLNTFLAMIPRTQAVVSGATIQLQLEEDIDISGTPVAKGNCLFGMATLSNERLQIKINSIRLGSNIYPISLEVYDMDGLSGIYVPGSITRDAAKQSADRAINGIGLTTVDPSLGAQAASAGIETVRSLIGRKTKLVKVTLPAGYQVLLKDAHSN